MNVPTGWTTYGSPLGPLTLVAGPSGVRGIHFPGPYGATTTYGELADAVERSLYPRSFARHERIRAAAAAIGRTPAPILVPCHGVIAADGSLTGYLGGLQRKQALLELEGRVAAGLPPVPAWSFRQTALL